jgi:3-oxoacyl-[acyl-carrier-protein] synthase-3
MFQRVLAVTLAQVVRSISVLFLPIAFLCLIAWATAGSTNGNTSAASIPLAMDALLAKHPELHGKIALLIGYGAGLVYAGQVVKLPPKP